MDRFRHWARRHRRRSSWYEGNSASEDEDNTSLDPTKARLRIPSPLPVAEKRLYRLSSFGNDDDYEDRNENCLFFSLLPPEIRRLIYVSLFGGRRVHLNVKENYKEKRWQVSSLVCHRKYVAKDGKVAEVNFAEDGCMHTLPYNTYCSYWIEDKSECKVHGLQWLQTCRLAQVLSWHLL
jgi:hypothetical protein